MLTSRQKYCLHWLLHNSQNHLEWRRGGKAAWGDSDKWDAMRISGTDGSITIAVADWVAIMPYKDQVDFKTTGKAFMPNEAGMSELTRD